jgi:hypothetical protein
MSETTLVPITAEEFAELWPKDDSGIAAANLAKRYLFTMLVHTAAGADCLDRAQAESASHKLLARLVGDFAKVIAPKREPKKPVTMAPLRRFGNTTPGGTSEKK